MASFAGAATSCSWQSGAARGLCVCVCADAVGPWACAAHSLNNVNPLLACRHRDRSLVQLQQALAALNASPLLPAAGLPALAPPATPGAADLQAVVSGARQHVDAAAAYLKQQGEAAPQAMGRKAQRAQQRAQQQLEQQLAALRAAVASLAEAAAGVRAPFEWADGPLVQVGVLSRVWCHCMHARLPASARRPAEALPADLAAPAPAWCNP